MIDVLHTTAGDWELEEVELTVAERTWRILHAGAVISREQEHTFLREETTAKRPYGAVVWPSSIALAHALASHANTLAGLRVLELGAGTGLPGIVAASLGARVVQTDRQALVLHVCERNAARNGAGATIEYRRADWTAWDDVERYDLIIGADILYAESLHPHVRHIFETNLTATGAVLLADPFRAASMPFLDALEADHWTIGLDKWTVGIAPPPRPVGVFTLTRRRR